MDLDNQESGRLVKIEGAPLSDNVRANSILSWKNICYEVDVFHKVGRFKKEKSQLKILTDVSGYAKSGECLAIIGGSGAGKSSLLNILADKFEKGKNARYSGVVKLNEHIMDFEKFKKIIGFVMQSDIFMEYIKVNEYLKFAIDMRYADLSEAEKNQKLENVIKKLKLEKAQNNLVGGAITKGISGGEKKRLNIGFELLADPSVIFLDEPTSGLDSYTSFLIVSLLQKIARENNVIIIYTIHQPSLDIFKLFDNLMVLDKGKSVYFGRADAAVDFYASMNHPCPTSISPPNHFIKVALKGGEEVNKQFNDHFLTYTVPEVDMSIQNYDYAQLNLKVNKAGFMTQFKVLMVRAFKNFVRNPMTFHVRIAQTLFLSFIFCCLYFQLSDDFTDPKNVFNRQGAFFFLAINIFIPYFMSYVLVCRVISSRRKRGIFEGIQFGTLRHRCLLFFQDRNRISFVSPFPGSIYRHNLLYSWLQPKC
jgi:ABC-type multidrug transport system ATPase subunit